MQDMENYTPRCQNYENTTDSSFKMRKYDMDDSKLVDNISDENHFTVDKKVVKDKE